MAIKGCFIVFTSVSFVITAFASDFNTTNPFSKDGLNSEVRTAVDGNTRLAARPLLSAHSAQYIIGPRCKATLPISSFRFSLATTRRISIGNFILITSFFFHVRLITAYPFIISKGIDSLLIDMVTLLLELD